MEVEHSVWKGNGEVMEVMAAERAVRMGVASNLFRRQFCTAVSD